MIASRNPELQKLLQAGIEAIQRRDRVRGRELLLEVVEQDDQSELAWLWLSVAVDNPYDRRTALENALVINPHNSKAQRRLERLREKLETWSSPQVPIITPEPAPRTVAAAGTNWKEVLPHAPQESDDGIDDPLQCVYCGWLTGPEDRACPHCGQKLFRRVRQSQSSEFMRLVLLLIGSTVAVGLVQTLGPLLRLNAAAGGEAGFEFLLKYFGVELLLGNFLKLSPVVAQNLAVIYFVRAGLLLGLLWGLNRRWTTAYYGALLVMLVDIFWSIYLLVSGYLGLLGCLVNGLFALAVLVLLFSVDREFAVNDERLLTRPDTTARSALDFYARGHDYRKLGMWALAVAQWRKAVGLAPKQAQYYKDLGIGYAQIKRFDRSLRVLEEAQRQAPRDKQIPEIIALVRAQAAKSAAPGR